MCLGEQDWADEYVRCGSEDQGEIQKGKTGERRGRGSGEM
jgi:hypothetical protein